MSDPLEQRQQRVAELIIKVCDIATESEREAIAKMVDQAASEDERRCAELAKVPVGNIEARSLRALAEAIRARGGK